MEIAGVFIQDNNECNHLETVAKAMPAEGGFTYYPQILSVCPYTHTGSVYMYNFMFCMYMLTYMCVYIKMQFWYVLVVYQLYKRS